MDDDSTKLAEIGGSLHGPILYREWNCYPRWRDAPWELIVSDIRGHYYPQANRKRIMICKWCIEHHKAAISWAHAIVVNQILIYDWLWTMLPPFVTSWNSSENSIVSNLTPQWFWLKSCIKLYPIYDFKLFFILLLYELSLQSEKFKSRLKKGALKTMIAITTRLHARRYQKKPRQFDKASSLFSSREDRLPLSPF